MKYRVGQRVLVTNAGRRAVNEPATIKQVDARDGTYWCVFDHGHQTERETWVGLSFEEKRLDPAWFDESELQAL